MKRKWVFFILFVTIVTTTLIIWFIWNKPHRNVQNEKGIVVSAIQLIQDFENDELSANKKYLNKAIVVSGKVLETSINQDGLPTVTIQSASLMSNVYCTLKKEQPIPDAGSIAVIKGICTGKLTDVVLIDAINDTK
ncbi:MAG: hypothetical protein KF781_08325 [Chitinophagaceae bacterium]|nr:hypothetical protein [Chitinophagaceae bacterium]MCW5905762.1 hypothetical protein [Chitinophagaceae bacterium]